MGHTSFNFELNRRQNKNKAYPIYLRISKDGKPKKIKMPIAVNRLTDFDSKRKRGQWIKPSEPNFAKWNSILLSELEKVEDTYIDLKDTGLSTTADNILFHIKDEDTQHSFLDYARKRTQALYDAGSFRNYKKYNGFCNKLERFLTDTHGSLRDLTFAELTPAFLSKFETFLRSLKNEREPDKRLHPNTIAIEFNIFKTLINRAIKIDRYMKYDDNPFHTFQYRGVKTMKEKLNEAEIERIEKLNLDKGSLMWHCRNYFLFSFYCAGIRAGDLVQLRWRNISSEGRLEYEMGKNHKYRDILLIPKALDILSLYHIEGVKPNDYIFPLLDSSASYAKAITQEEKDTLSIELRVKLFNQIEAKNALINKYLKQIAKQANITKNVSFHIARHSFGRIAKTKKVDNGILKNLFAHSSIKITEAYMGDFDTSQTDKAFMAIFDT